MNLIPFAKKTHEVKIYRKSTGQIALSYEESTELSELIDLQTNPALIVHTASVPMDKYAEFVSIVESINEQYRHLNLSLSELGNIVKEYVKY